MDIDFRTIELMGEVYKKTLAYELERVKINDDDSTTHLHSDRFLDEHPERRESPEFTEEEEKDQFRFISVLVQKLFSFFKRKELK